MTIVKPVAGGMVRSMVVPIVGGENGHVFANAEASALVARFTTPPTQQRKVLIDQLVGALKTGGVWSKLDAFWVMAAADSQAAKLNWIADAYNLTEASAPIFTADRGYAGDGVASLGTGFNPTTAPSPKYVQDSASFGVSINVSGQGDVSAMGIGNAFIDPYNAGGNTARRVNQASSQLVARPNALGRHVNVRRSAAAVEHYTNGASIATATTASATPSAEAFSILKRGASGGGATVRASTAFIGSQLSATEVAALDAAILNYLTPIGAA